MAKELILIVEDDRDILELISYNLYKEGYLVKGFTSGEDLLSHAQTVGGAGCIVLDIMLPGMDGLDVCKAVRSEKSMAHIPVIMLTARGEEVDIVTGLEIGADDYIVKPFSPRVLVARVRALLRRKRQESNINRKPLRIHDIEILPGRHEVFVKGKPVQLTSSEFKALYFLAQHPGWVYTRYQIVEEIHGSNYPVTDRSVDVLMVGLRQKLGDAAACIQTVRGIGYRFKDRLESSGKSGMEERHAYKAKMKSP